MFGHLFPILFCLHSVHVHKQTPPLILNMKYTRSSWWVSVSPEIKLKSLLNWSWTWTEVSFSISIYERKLKQNTNEHSLAHAAHGKNWTEKMKTMSRQTIHCCRPFGPLWMNMHRAHRFCRYRWLQCKCNQTSNNVLLAANAARTKRETWEPKTKLMKLEPEHLCAISERVCLWIQSPGGLHESAVFFLPSIASARHDSGNYWMHTVARKKECKHWKWTPSWGTLY